MEDLSDASFSRRSFVVASMKSVACADARTRGALAEREVLSTLIQVRSVDGVNWYTGTIPGVLSNSAVYGVFWTNHAAFRCDFLSIITKDYEPIIVYYR